jgi:hypothetical protein
VSLADPLLEREELAAVSSTWFVRHYDIHMITSPSFDHQDSVFPYK